jgi:hypothetical protein
MKKKSLIQQREKLLVSDSRKSNLSLQFEKMISNLKLEKLKNFLQNDMVSDLSLLSNEEKKVMQK